MGGARGGPRDLPVGSPRGALRPFYVAIGRKPRRQSLDTPTASLLLSKHGSGVVLCDAQEEAGNRAALMAWEDKPIGWFHPNPLNYNTHPDSQLHELQASIQKHGVVRNVVAMPDGTILAGHGIVEAAEMRGEESLHVFVYEGNERDGNEYMLADNKLAEQSVDDTRQLTALLSELQLDCDGADLSGTGIDEGLIESLTALAKAEEEVAAQLAAGEEDDFGPQDESYLYRVIIQCDSEEECRLLCEQLGLEWDIARRTYQSANTVVASG